MNLWHRFLEGNDFEPTHAIIGVDPGGTTGVFSAIMFENFVNTEASIETGTHTRIVNVGALVSHTQIPRDDYPERTIGSLLKIALGCGVPRARLHVAIEKYIITQRTAKLTRQPDALEVTGAVKNVADEHGAHVWSFSPSNAKKFASNDLLDRVGWMTKRGLRDRHARDAARQVWSCFAEIDFPLWEAFYDGKHMNVDGDELIISYLNEIMRNERKNVDDTE